MRRRDPVIDLLFENLPGAQECPWRPAADVLRTDQGWVVKLDLAGVNPQEVSITIEGRILRVAGARRDLHASKNIDHYRMEIAYSHFERRIELPGDPGDWSISAEYLDGMLLILLEERK